MNRVAPQPSWIHRCSRLVAGLSTLSLAGCATHVPQVLGPQVVPRSFASQDPAAPELWPTAHWWQEFGSEELSELVSSAQSGNRDIAVAAARVLEARAQVTVQGSILWPQLNLQPQVTRSATGPGNSGSSFTNGPTAGTINTFSLSALASLQPDIWGLARANLHAAHEALKSSRYAQQAVALSVTTNVAVGYFQILALRERIEIAREEIAAINSILSVIKLRVSTGKSSHLDLAQEQAQAESVESQLTGLEEQELEARMSVAVLLGRLPEQLQIVAQNADAVRAPRVAPGLPSQLLVRRPDVAQAEANLAAAHANVDAARAAFFPQFTLTGSGGYASTSLSTLVRASSFVWNAGGSLLQVIFDGGKLVGQHRLAEATQRELVASYENAVLTAYADVETALAQVSNNLKSREHLLHAVEAAQEAFEIAQLQYRQGVTDLLNVLQAQQTLFATKDQLSQISLAHRQAIVHLYAALGGGWEEPRNERTQLMDRDP